MTVNGKPVRSPVRERGYLVLAREWRTGDAVELDLPMPVQRIAAHPNVKEDAGQFALQRGPLVYCLEACDQTEPLASLYLPASAELKAEKKPGMLGGVVAVQGFAEVAADLDWSGRLYRPAAASRRVPITAIPYYAWDNRQAGAMQVWLPSAPPCASSRRSGEPSHSHHVLRQRQLSAGGHQRRPSNRRRPGSNRQRCAHWWPHKGSDEWVQYTWSQPVTIGGAKVYWFDDTGRGECRLPAAWHLQYLDGQVWRPVAGQVAFAIQPDAWCEAEFTPVTTVALRLAVKLPPAWAAGVHEWKVTEADEAAP